MANSILGNGIVMLPVDEYKRLLKLDQTLAGMFTAEKDCVGGSIRVYYNPAKFYDYFVQAARAEFGDVLDIGYDLKDPQSYYQSSELIAIPKGSTGGPEFTG